MKTFLITNTFLILSMLPGISWGQFIAISGYITDSSNGKALENVSIFDSNSQIGTITNENGFYRLILRDSKADLTFSYHGFKDYSRLVEMSADTTLLVGMEPMFLGKKLQKKDETLHASNSLGKNGEQNPNPEFK